MGERQLRFSVRAVIPAAKGQVRGNIGRVIGRNLQQEHLAFLFFIQKLVAEQGGKSRGVIFGLLIGQKIGAHKLVNKLVEVEVVRVVLVSLFAIVGNPAQLLGNDCAAILFGGGTTPGGTVTLQDGTSVGAHLLGGQSLNIVNDVVLKGHRDNHAFKYRIVQVQEEGDEPLRAPQLSQLIVTSHGISGRSAHWNTLVRVGEETRKVPVGFAHRRLWLS